MPTHLNPADYCSRGLSPEDPKWATFHGGPEFLKGDESLWPETKVPVEERREDFGFPAQIT